jgi:hypothetical protein
MLHAVARGKSGRIVVEVLPALKRELYLALEQENLTLREWFIRNATSFIESKRQPSLFGKDDEHDTAR